MVNTVKTNFVTLTVIHVILIAVSQRLVTLPCSDKVCWFALRALALYAPLGEVSYQQSQSQAKEHQYRIAGNFRMVQSFAYFEHVPSVRKLELSKIYTDTRVDYTYDGSLSLPNSKASH